MNTYLLRITLLSDATFGRGDGLAGVVDNEIQHDELGFPYLSGKEIKGILVEECAGLLAAFSQQEAARWKRAAARLFGQAGSGLADEACLKIGDARLPDDLAAALRRQFKRSISELDPQSRDYAKRREHRQNQFRSDTLSLLTDIRRQTALDEVTGAAKAHSLRATRVIIRGAVFESELCYFALPGESASDQQDDLALLAACVRAFRRAGAGRTRGRGKLLAELFDENRKALASAYLALFQGGAQ